VSCSGISLPTSAIPPGLAEGTADVHPRSTGIRPEYLTHRFPQICKELGLPPIRLHDLRHGAATIALASHTDLKVIQQILGHSSIVTTADTYTSVLPEAAHRAAQATADMVIEAARSAPGVRPGGTVVTHIPAAVTAPGYCQM
jgi:Phage integrase family